MIKHCVICGAAFKSPPSAKTVTCSPACRAVRAGNAARNSSRKWSQSARDKRAADPAIRAKMAQIQAVGTAAAMLLPEGQRGPQNRASKAWELIAPDGEIIEVANLLDWARNNYTLFEPPNADPDQAAMRISSGFKAIASSMRGVKSRKRRVSSYKGWGLKALPKNKEDTNNDH